MVLEDREAVRQSLRARVEEESTRTRIKWRLGRRGAFLVMMGVLFIVLGVLYGFSHAPQSVFDQLAMPLQVMEFIGVHDDATALRAWGTLWMFSGVTACVTAWWPPGRDHIGFSALWLYSCTWSLLNFVGQFALDAPRAGIVGILFAVYAATILIVSGMEDPTPVTRVAVGDHDAR